MPRKQRKQASNCPLCHGSLFPLGGDAHVCENCEVLIEDGKITSRGDEYGRPLFVGANTEYEEKE